MMSVKSQGHEPVHALKMVCQGTIKTRPCVRRLPKQIGFSTQQWLCLKVCQWPVKFSTSDNETELPSTEAMPWVLQNESLCSQYVAASWSSVKGRLILTSKQAGGGYCISTGRSSQSSWVKSAVESLGWGWWFWEHQSGAKHLGRWILGWMHRREWSN